MNTGVYVIRNTINNKFYIGSAAGIKGFSGRFSKHRSSLRKGNSLCTKLQRSWNKYGEEAFKFEILERCPREKCIEREQFYIDLLKPPLNILPTAGSWLGMKHSEKTKRKMRGRVMSEESKRRLSKAKTGTISALATPVRLIEENIIFRCATEAADYVTNLRGKKSCNSFIAKCCRGIKSKAYGFSWEYVN